MNTEIFIVVCIEHDDDKDRVQSIIKYCDAFKCINEANNKIQQIKIDFLRNGGYKYENMTSEQIDKKFKSKNEGHYVNEQLEIFTTKCNI